MITRQSRDCCFIPLLSKWGLSSREMHLNILLKDRSYGRVAKHRVREIEL
jgi:hypothetical protein